jgi:hypothetical protein
LTAFRYLNEDPTKVPDRIIPMVIAKKAPIKIQLFLTKVFDELNFLTIDDTIKNIVPPMRAIPGSPNTNERPGLGNKPADNSVATVNKTATINGILISVRKKVTAKKNNEIGILKY